MKFGAVGLVGMLIDLLIYNLGISALGWFPATAKAVSTAFAILNNFTWHHRWTFRRRPTRTRVWQKLGLFNLVSFGGLALGVVMVKALHSLYGDGWVRLWEVSIPYYNLYFFATLPVVAAWNFTLNHLVTWKPTRP
jgi:dolichol-phosphate mannosyltransferase